MKRFEVANKNQTPAKFKLNVKSSTTKIHFYYPQFLQLLTIITFFASQIKKLDKTNWRYTKAEYSRRPTHITLYITDLLLFRNNNPNSNSKLR